ncbi:MULTISPECIES: carbohydrate ABC transporter permease [unclassified Bilifractor]|uniref:carbohydrate ABC transporter permease n=2 Tax=Bilifractor TaxID=2815776 RepID=UPI003F9077E7
MKVRMKKKMDFSEGAHGVYSTRAKVGRSICSVILILYTCITIFVLGVTILDSLKTKSDLVTNFAGLPRAISFASYDAIIKKGDFLRYFFNSVIVTACGTVGCILLSSMAAYGIARYQFKGKKILSAYFMIGMMVPIQVSILPLFILLRNLGLLNKLSGLILVYISGISMSCLIFQKFFRAIPTALEESARLDGCSDLRVFFQIILPITKPVMFTMGLITAIGQWNDFYMPMVLLGNKNVTTLTLAIYRYIGQFTRYMSESMAAVVITLIPIIILYFAFSSQIVQGLTGGAVKG